MVSKPATNTDSCQKSKVFLSACWLGFFLKVTIKVINIRQHFQRMLHYNQCSFFWKHIQHFFGIKAAHSTHRDKAISNNCFFVVIVWMQIKGGLRGDSGGSRGIWTYLPNELICYQCSLAYCNLVFKTAVFTQSFGKLIIENSKLHENSEKYRAY